MYKKLKELYTHLEEMVYFNIPTKQGNEVERRGYYEHYLQIDKDTYIYLDKNVDDPIFGKYILWYQDAEYKIKVTAYRFFVQLQPIEFPLEITKEDILKIIRLVEDSIDVEAVRNHMKERNKKIEYREQLERELRRL